MPATRGEVSCSPMWAVQDELGCGAQMVHAPAEENSSETVLRRLGESSLKSLFLQWQHSYHRYRLRAAALRPSVVSDLMGKALLTRGVGSITPGKGRGQDTPMDTEEGDRGTAGEPHRFPLLAAIT